MLKMMNVFGIPFLFAFIGSSLFIAIPLFILKLGITDLFKLAMAGVAFQACYIPCCILHSRFAKFINRRKSFLVVSIIYPLIILSFILTHEISWIIFLCGLMGATLSMFWPAYQTHITINLDQCRMTKNLQGFNLGWGSGAVLGSLLGGILFSIHPRAVFYFDFIISLAVLGLIFGYIKDNFMNSTSKGVFDLAGTGKNHIVQENLSPALETRSNIRKFLFFGWMGTFVAWFCIGILIWLFPKFATDVGVNSSMIGFLRAMLGVFQIVIFFILGLNHCWQYSFPQLIIYELMLIAGFVILIIFASTLWWMLAFALIGTATGFIYSSSLLYSSRARTAKSEKTGFHEAVVVGGALFGTLAGGIVARTFSAGAAYAMCIGLIGLCIGLQMWIQFKFSLTLPSPLGGED